MEKLAEQLEFIYEEASIKDENGNIIGFDFEGSATGANNITIGENSSNTGITTMAVPNKNKIDACVQKKIKNAFMETLTLTTINTLLTLAKDKKYKTLAKKLLALGIKGNAPAIALQLLYYNGTCVYKYNDW
ncbi:hypothetical protein [Peribacillus sp. NPDC097225]|uniref:hypothetical protein n=1 Tax=Peribacillus sp. NPDC097225 TaxID=3364400 RepID=UPI0037FA6060